MKRLISLALVTMLVMGTTMGCGKKELLLKDAYEDYFPIGTALGSYSLARYEDSILNQFNSITAESDMKWSYTHPSENRFTYDAADELIAVAKERGMKVRGHALVWYRSLPRYVMGDSPSKEVLLDRMRTHIDETVKYFGDSVYCWDVANEVLKSTVTEADLNSGNFYRTGEEAKEGNNLNDWYAIAGREYISEAFKQARKSADEIGHTDLKLYYNDYSLNEAGKRQALIALVNYLRSSGAPIDGIGMQAHYDIYNFNIDEFEESVRAYLDLGLDVQLTELDLSIYQWTYSGEHFSELPENLAKIQAKVYEEIFAVMRKYSTPYASGKGKTTGVTFWTTADDSGWLDNDPVPNRKNFPALFNEDLEPKDAFFKVVNFEEGK